jgi:peptidoglycan/xylan/chitin deacetylase (PgdA/CDA1 family)
MGDIRQSLGQLYQKIPSRYFFQLYYKFFNRSNFGVIVTLHSVTKTASEQSRFNSFIEISVSKLEEVISCFRTLGVRFVSLSELSTIIALGKKPRHPVVHFSFDDGYKDNFTLAFPLLKNNQIPFSVFVTSDFISRKKPFTWWYILEDLIIRNEPIFLEKYGLSITSEDYSEKGPDEIFKEVRTLILNYFEKDFKYFEEHLSALSRRSSIPEMMNWDDINEMLSWELFDLGIHSKTHPRFSNLSTEQKEEEIASCRREIRQKTGVLSKYFAFPYGSLEDIGDVNETTSIIDKLDIQLAFTTVAGMLNGNTDRRLVPRIFINESANSYTLKSQLNGLYQTWGT